MPVAYSSSSERLEERGLTMMTDDSSCWTSSITSAGVSFFSGAVDGAAATTTNVSLPCSDMQPRSDDSSVSTNTDVFPSDNNHNGNANDSMTKADHKEAGVDEQVDDDEDYGLQDAQSRISHALPQASAAAHALFGVNVGPCWGDYACTHHCIPGRFYATTCAILFHTKLHLRGLERRVCLLFNDIVSMQLVRTTSIKIQTMDRETYVFKSFGDRERVLHLLNGLKILADHNQNYGINNTKQQEIAGVARNSGSDIAPPRGNSSSCHGHRNSSSRVNNNINNNSNMSSTNRSVSDEERRRQQRPLSRLPENDESCYNNIASSMSSPTRRAASFSSLTGGLFKIPLSSSSISSSIHGIPPPPSSSSFPLLSRANANNNRRRAMSDSIVPSTAVPSVVEEEHPIPLTEPPLDQSFMNLNGIVGGCDFDSSFVQNDEHDNNSNSNENSTVNNTMNDTNCPSFFADDDDDHVDEDKDHDMMQLQLQPEPEQEQRHQQGLESSWERAKQWHPTPTGEALREVGVESVILSPCSLQDFFQHFLSNQAKYSLDWYQREYIKDYNVQISNWQRSPPTPAASAAALDMQQHDDLDVATATAFQRTMTFTHPINHTDCNTNNNNSCSSITSSSWSSSFSSMISPSAAKTTRHQHLNCFAGFGMVLANKTLVQGIPACDTFYVQDKWIVEVVRHPLDVSSSSLTAAPPPQLRLSVRFEPHFTKRSLLKAIIQNSVRKETKDWMAGYVDMLQGAIQELTARDAVNRNSYNASSSPPTKPKTTCMVPTTSSRGGTDEDAAASNLLPVVAIPSNSVAKSSKAAVVSTAIETQQQQLQQGDILFAAKSLQRLVAFAIVLVILLGVLLLFQLIALQATLSTLQLRVQGVYVQNAMVMCQLQRQLLALGLQQPHQIMS
jgi:hypothetical protein